MDKDKEFHAIRTLVFELSKTSSVTYDLDILLEQLFAILHDYPDIPLEMRGAIVLCNPRGRFFQVAQYGMEPVWKCDFCWPEFFENTVLLPGSTIRSGLLDDPQSVKGQQQLLLLPLNSKYQLDGYLVLYSGPAYQPTEIDIDFFTDLAEAFTVMLQRTLNNEVLQLRELELDEAREDAIRSLGTASSYRDNETGWHVVRMSNFAVAIAKAMELTEEQRELLHIAAPMHDVGKIGISDSILLKPGKLTAEEFEIMKTHTRIGMTILSGKDEMITAARDIAGSHHERWDGTGYPMGLSGDNIPLLARVCAVADVFDALTSERPYKEPWSVIEATDWITSKSGEHFDPNVVRAFEIALPEILRIRELYRDDIIDPNQTVNLPPLPPRKNDWVKWSDELKIGIDVIDEHHRYLFDLINDLFEVVTNKRGAREVARLVKATDAYARVHFRTEEQMMKHYGYDGIKGQEKQHHAFESKIREFYEELHINPLVAQFDVLTYLRDWLIHHIHVEDAKLYTLVSV